MICMYWPAAGSDCSGFWPAPSNQCWVVRCGKSSDVFFCFAAAGLQWSNLWHGQNSSNSLGEVPWWNSELGDMGVFKRKKLVCVFFEIFWSWIFYSDSSGESLKIFEPTLKLQCILRMVSIGRWSPLCQWNTRNMCREENFTKQQASTLTVSSRRSQPSDSSILRSPKNFNKVCPQPTISPGGF